LPGCFNLIGEIKQMLKLYFVTLFITLFFTNSGCCQKVECFLPAAYKNRTTVDSLKLTSIGHFGQARKARPNIPAHLHTGIDIKRPNNNYKNELIFPVAGGKVISIRDDGPYAQIIIEHQLESGKYFWTVYEHVSGIRADIGEQVNPFKPIARFMNKDELNNYGWQFDHLHFEILKKRPRPLKPTSKLPYRLFVTYSLKCSTKSDLNNYYFDPIDFIFKFTN
jgi:murein DD-endopeptidase MepM/ murein hydrolase activator NlpD